MNAQGDAPSVGGLGGGYQVMLMPNSAEMPEHVMSKRWATGITAVLIALPKH